MKFDQITSVNRLLIVESRLVANEYIVYSHLQTTVDSGITKED